MFIIDANLHGFADDHTISASDKDFENLKNILIHDSEIAIKWLKNNDMIANPGRFQAIILGKSKKTTHTTFIINGKEIESKENVKLLGINIDNKLNFDDHVSKLCSRASGQLNTLFRFNNYLTPETKILAINSFIVSNFQYFPLVWHFSSEKSINKIEQVKKRALKFLLNEPNLSYHELLTKAKRPTMKVDRLRTLCTEINKTIKDINPSYMNEDF